MKRNWCKNWIRTGVVSLLYSAGIAWSSTHGLILAISEYPGSAALPGVKDDVALAKKMARWMNVQDSQLTVIQDSALGLEGFRQTLARFAESVQPGDDVFLYYSGHGGRMEIQRIGEAKSQCAEAFVSIDLKFYMDKEFRAWLEGISDKAAKVIVFADSCHSGGVAATKGLSRSLAAKDLRPKTLPKLNPPENNHCEPVNLAKSIVMTRSLRSNVVYIAAAREDEVAWSTAAGSTASLAWASCLDKKGVDKDSSGGITAEELRRCAQSWIDGSGYNQHLKIIGNERMVLGFDGGTSYGNAGNGINTVAMPPRPPAQLSASIAATLDNLLYSADPKRAVTVRPVRDRAVIGRDSIDFDVTTPDAGYLYLLYAGSDGRTIDLLFPNKLDQDNYVQAGTHRFPRASWLVTASGPTGTDRIVAIVSPVKRTFANFAAGDLGTFSLLVDERNWQGARNLTVEAIRPGFLPASDCGTRNLSVTSNQRDCVGAYGVGMARIEEVR